MVWSCIAILFSFAVVGYGAGMAWSTYPLPAPKRIKRMAIRLPYEDRKHIRLALERSLLPNRKKGGV